MLLVVLVVETTTVTLAQEFPESQIVRMAVPGATPVMEMVLLLMVATRAVGLELVDRL